MADMTIDINLLLTILLNEKYIKYTNTAYNEYITLYILNINII